MGLAKAGLQSKVLKNREQRKDLIIATSDYTATDLGWGILHASVLVTRTKAYSIPAANVFPPPSASALTLAVPIKVQLAEPAISSAVLPFLALSVSLPSFVAGLTSTSDHAHYSLTSLA